MKHKILVPTLICLSLLAPGMATFANTDAQLQEISAQLQSQLETLKSWSHSNQQSAEILLAQSDNAMDLAEFDHQKPISWSTIDSLNQESMGLLHATKALWQNYADFNQYLASYKQSEAWKNCLERSVHGCTFRKVLSNMDVKSIGYATEAVKQAENSQQVIEEQIARLENLSAEAENAEGLAANLDALSKVNAASVSSLSTLNNSINTMIRMQATETAARHSLSQAQSEGTLQLLTGGTHVSSPHYELRISDHVR